MSKRRPACRLRSARQYTRLRLAVNRRPQYGALLDLGRGACLLELLQHGLGLIPRHRLLDRLGGAVDEVFGLFEAQTGDLADGLDDVDLGITGCREDNTE